jgi:small subunit ribosomal protein S8
MMTDSLADMLTRIRNANRIERAVVDMPSTKLKQNVAQVLKDEGFIIDFQVGQIKAGEGGTKNFEAEPTATGSGAVLRVYLKYGPEGEKVIRHLGRISTPGCRIYRRTTELRPILDGLGIAVISTNKGVMSDRRARAERLGGEILCNVW